MLANHRGINLAVSTNKRSFQVPLLLLQAGNDKVREYGPWAHIEPNRKHCGECNKNCIHHAGK